MTSATAPRSDAALTQRGDLPTREYAGFFRDLATAFNLAANLPQDIQALTVRVGALEKETGAQIGNVVGDSSIVTDGVLHGGVVTVHLLNDVDMAPALSFYGAITEGVKGWQTCSASFAALNNGDGTYSLDLADLANSGTGAALVKITRDAKGRLSGTSAATTTDLAEGSNLYFTAARVLASILTGLSTATSAVISATDTVLSALGKLQAQVTANYNNTVKLLGNIIQISDAGQWRLQANRVSGSSDLAMRLVAGASFSATDGAIFELNGAQTSTRPGEVRCLTDGSPITFAAGLYGFAMSNAAGGVGPTGDNNTNCGSFVLRWKVVYAGTGTINTSDAREKTEVAPLTDVELAAASALAREPGTYQWLASVAEKGPDKARHHAGLTVQRAIAIMQSHGLDPFRYGFICYDSWGELPEVIDPETGEVTQAYRPAGDRYSFRTDELLLFIARGFAARLDALETAR